MVVKIGRIAAVCPACGHEEFRCAEEHPGPMDVMTCDKCATKVTYGFLTEQIFRRSVDEADAALKAAKDKKVPPS